MVSFFRALQSLMNLCFVYLYHSGPLVKSDRILSTMPHVALALFLLGGKVTEESFWKPYIGELLLIVIIIIIGTFGCKQHLLEM